MHNKAVCKLMYSSILLIFHILTCIKSLEKRFEKNHNIKLFCETSKKLAFCRSFPSKDCHQTSNRTVTMFLGSGIINHPPKSRIV